MVEAVGFVPKSAQRSVLCSRKFQRTYYTDFGRVLSPVFANRAITNEIRLLLSRLSRDPALWKFAVSSMLLSKTYLIVAIIYSNLIFEFNGTRLYYHLVSRQLLRHKIGRIIDEQLFYKLQVKTVVSKLLRLTSIFYRFFVIGEFRRDIKPFTHISLI